MWSWVVLGGPGVVLGCGSNGCPRMVLGSSGSGVVLDGSAWFCSNSGIVLELFWGGSGVVPGWFWVVGWVVLGLVWAFWFVLG